MISESSKDASTGKILMLHDGETGTQEVLDYLERNHSQDVNIGDQLHFIEAAITFVPKGSECDECPRPAVHRQQDYNYVMHSFCDACWAAHLEICGNNGRPYRV